MVSQLPPVAVDALAVKLKAVPVLATIRACGRGLAPAYGLVKLSALICRKTLAPTMTVTGTDRLPLADWKTSSPLKGPAPTPAPGGLWGDIDTLTHSGPVPFVGVALSQFPLSAVLVATVHDNVPDPALRS